jgi:tRNA uridine 5-carboxymethylaminomethyl modification enzyme
MDGTWVRVSKGWYHAEVCHGVFIYEEIFSYRDSAFDILRNPFFKTSHLLPHVPGLADISPRTLARLDVEGRYDAFLVRQEADLKAFAADEEMLLDEGIDYKDVEGLSSEVRERLGKVRPASIVSPSSV